MSAAPSPQFEQRGFCQRPCSVLHTLLSERSKCPCHINHCVHAENTLSAARQDSWPPRLPPLVPVVPPSQTINGNVSPLNDQRQLRSAIAGVRAQIADARLHSTAEGKLCGAVPVWQVPPTTLRNWRLPQPLKSVDSMCYP